MRIAHNAYFGDYFQPAKPLTPSEQYFADCKRAAIIRAERKCTQYVALQIARAERAAITPPR